ncbi:acyl--CoA ligase [Candidatus Saccharibacteria bacterium]|nr:acyl--CoA ligase [Candidatus Saccharibacteria bacterium]
MLEFLFNKIKSGVRKLDMRIERAKYGHIEKLPREVKYFEGSMYEAILKSAEKYPNSTALEYFHMEISYRDMIKKINHVAASLKSLGVKKGECVTICMPNTPESVYAFYAVNEIGAVANMVHPLSSEKEIEDYLIQSESRVMLCVDVAYKKTENIIKNTNVEHLVVVSPARSMDFLVRFVFKLTKGRKNHIKKTQEVTTWDRFLLKGMSYSGILHVHTDPHDPAVILYSGGTTGKPKGVILTSYNFNAQALGAKYLVSELLKPRYSMLSFLPNFHAFGLGVCIHIPLYCGMRVVLIPQFNAKKFKSYIKKYRINIIVGVPTAFEYLTKLKFGPRDLRKVKGAVSGGDVISDAMKEKINNFFKEHGSKAIIQNGYGLTEAAGGMIFSERSIAGLSGTIGYPLPDSEALIVNPKTMKPVKTGQDGEILVRGLTTMKGYLNKPEETKKAFVKVGAKKYLRTGDIGYVNESGAVFFKSRLKRLIISKGYNVYPTKIEEVTLKCEAVEACACVGVSDEIRGEKICIFIVKKPDTHERIIKKELNKLYKKYLAKYEIPQEIRFIDELPKTKLAKVDFVALKAFADSPRPR